MAGLDIASRDAPTAGPSSSYARIPQESDDQVPFDSRRSGTSRKQARISNNDDDDNVDNDDGGSEGDSGWHLDDLDDETYELVRNGVRSSTSTSDRHKARTGVPQGDRRLEAGRRNDDGDDSDEEDALAMVRAVVSEDDDPTLPNLTFRVLVLGTILCAVGAAISQLFFFKSNAPSFSGFLIILLSYPAGHWMARILPTRQFQLWNGRYTFTLNPGPFNAKEHLLITVLAGSGSGAAYGADIITIQDLYYHQDIGHVGGVLLVLSTQMLGFGLSGLVYNLLVRPSKMVWPSTLVPISLFNTLHGQESTITWQRLRFFRLAFLAIFAWQFMPSVVAPVLTSFATLCILSPASSIATAKDLGSAYTGFGIANLSFDWSVVGSMGGLFVPWFASLNRFAGFMGMCWIIGPLIYYSNFWEALSFDSPIGPKLYNRFFQKFDITSVIDAQTLSLDVAKWDSAKPLLLTPYFAMTYGISFATLTAAITTVIIWHWRDISDASFSSTSSSVEKPEADVHVQMMEATYESVPNSWYAWVGGSMLVAAIYVIVFYPMQLPVWGLLLSLVIAFLFLPACGIIAATTGTVIGLNVITEFIAGYLFPGQPIGNVAFKCYGYMVMAQALALVSDLKLGLYCKIKPKAMFICQCYGTALGAVVNYIYVKSVINAKRPYLDGTLEDPTGQWTGRAPAIFYSASVIWGLVGPAEFFAGKYKLLYLGFPIGAVLPVIPWYLSKRYPKQRFWKKLSLPLILDGSAMAPQVPTNTIVMGLLSAWASQRYALKKHPRWYEKYNFVLSAALDAGTSIQALLIYLLGLGVFPEWWGNSSIDSEQCKIAK